MACFGEALRDAAIPQVLHDRLATWFRDANAYVNHNWESPDDVPDGLAMPLVRTFSAENSRLQIP